MKNLLKNRFLQLCLVLLAGVLLGSLLPNRGRSGGSETTNEANSESAWTCSMHPQIRLGKDDKCPLCGMDLIPVTGQGGSGANQGPFVHSMTPEAVALANVQTAKVSYASPEHEIFLTGKIAVNEKKFAAITANYSGRIEELFVNFTGQMVRKGQKMATIYSPELITAQKELLEVAKHKDNNPVLYNAARERLRLWKVNENQINAIEAGGKIMTEVDIYADMAGIVTNRQVSTGDYVNKGNILFEIADLSSVWVLLDAYENDLPWLRVGEVVTFSLASVPAKEFKSTVTFIDPFIDPQTRTASVRAEALNPGLILKPEMFVNARVKSKVSFTKNTMLIPKTSILWTGKRSVVYVKIPDGEFPAFEMREVNLGLSAGDFHVVEGGLQEGEEVVINGVFALDAAAQLSGNYSMMNRPISKRLHAPEEFRNQLTTLTRAYFKLNDALVESDFDKSRKSSLVLQKSIVSVDMGLLEGKAHDVWVELEKPLSKSVQLFSDAADLAEQRKHFEIISDKMIEAAETFGLSIDVINVAYCSMALENKGASWLSTSADIRNPYFGEAMLKCGEIKKRIRSIDSYQNDMQ